MLDTQLASVYSCGLKKCRVGLLDRFWNSGRVTRPTSSTPSNKHSSDIRTPDIETFHVQRQTADVACYLGTQGL